MLTSNSMVFGISKKNENHYSDYSPDVIDVPKTKTTPHKYKSKEIVNYSSGAWFERLDKSEKYYLNKPLWELRDFSLHFKASKTDYLNFDIKNIKILFFKNPIWNSSLDMDEYEEKSETNIQELFNDLDEIKVKQLLLSLSIRSSWQLLSSRPYFWNGHDPITPSKVSDLGNLKIKYFSEFSDLKNYVHAKVKICQNQKKPCFASPGELDILEQDKQSFFEQ